MALFSGKHRKQAVIVGGVAILFISTFQNCSRTRFTEIEESQVQNSSLFIVDTGPAIINEIKLTHSPGQRNFKINIAGLPGGHNNCRMQYEKNGSVWTNLSSEFICNERMKDVSFDLPSNDGWTNNFNSSGVRVRIVKSSDLSEVAVFSEKLTCLNKVSAVAPTPTTDENCDGRWDDVVVGADKTCDQDSGAHGYGTAYECAPTKSCGGKTAIYTEHIWTQFSYFYTQPNCSIGSILSIVYGFTDTARLPDTSGTTPAYNGGEGCVDIGGGYYIILMSGAWLRAKCTYQYREDNLYN